MPNLALSSARFGKDLDTLRVANNVLSAQLVAASPLINPVAGNGTGLFASPIL